MNSFPVPMLPPFHHNRSNYKSAIELPFLLIEDQGGARSVTNDVEFVILDHVSAGIDVDSLIVIYRDSEGVLDGIKTKASRFDGFFALRTSNLDEAKTFALGR